jgi:Tol biopolymer transport system component
MAAASRSEEQEAIRRQLQRILLSPQFLHSDRLRRFLSHCVESSTSGRPEDLKEYTIATTVFDRPKHFNPAEDPIVRVEARRLRKKLEEYYQTQGAGDPIVIQMPKGGYVTVFHFRHFDRPVWRRAWGWAGMAAAIAAVAIWGLALRPAGSLPELTLTRLTSSRGLTTDPQLTPDGTKLVYATDRGGTGGLDIWIQEGDSARPLTNDPLDDSQPSISPDGSLVAFRSERQPPGIYEVPAAGGEISAGGAKLVAPDGRNPRFSPDGAWIAYWVGSPGGDTLPPAGKTYIVRSSGGTARPVLGQVISAACPVWSPNGKSLLVEVTEKVGDSLDLLSVSIDHDSHAPTGARAILDRAQLKFSMRECAIAWGRDSLVLSALQGDTQNLWRLPVSASGQVIGRPTRLTLGPGHDTLPFASLSGAIAFVGRTEAVDLWRVPVDHPDKLSRVAEGAPSATFPSAAKNRVAYLSQGQVWLSDLETGRGRQLTHGSPGEIRYPQLCPDAETIVYSSGPNAFAVSAKAPAPRLVCNGCAQVWQCNQEDLIYLPAGTNRPNPIYQLRKAIPGGQSEKSPPTLLVSSPYDLSSPQRSPDGWLAYHAITGPARRQIFAMKESRPKTAVPVTDGQHLDRNAVWNERSDTLYFISERCGFRCLWSQRVDRATKIPVGEPAAVRHFHSARQSLSAIGDVGAIGPAYAGGYLFFAMADLTGDIWVAKHR